MKKTELHKYNLYLRENDTIDINNIVDDSYTDLQKTLLKNRITDSPEDYNGRFDITKDLYKLTDVDKAGELLAKHINKKSRIALVTDMDCD